MAAEKETAKLLVDESPTTEETAKKPDDTTEETAKKNDDTTTTTAITIAATTTTTTSSTVETKAQEAKGSPAVCCDGDAHTHASIKHTHGSSEPDGTKTPITHKSIQQVYGKKANTKRNSSDLTHQQLADLLGGKTNRPVPTHKEIAKAHGIKAKKEEEEKERLDLIRKQVVRCTRYPLLDDKVGDFGSYVENQETKLLNEKINVGSLISFRRHTNQDTKMTYTHEIYPSTEKFVEELKLQIGAMEFYDLELKNDLEEIWCPERELLHQLSPLLVKRDNINIYSGFNTVA